MEAQSPEAQGGGREPDTPDGAVGRAGGRRGASERVGGEAGLRGWGAVSFCHSLAWYSSLSSVLSFVSFFKHWFIF